MAKDQQSDTVTEKKWQGESKVFILGWRNRGGQGLGREKLGGPSGKKGGSSEIFSEVQQKKGNRALNNRILRVLKSREERRFPKLRPGKERDEPARFLKKN